MITACLRNCAFVQNFYYHSFRWEKEHMVVGSMKRMSVEVQLAGTRGGFIPFPLLLT